MYFYVGLSRGSSGGCVNDERGRAVAFHISSKKSSLTAEEASTKREETKVSGKESKVAIDSISDPVDSTYITTCVVISYQRE